MLAINVLFFSCIFRVLGGGIIQLPRWIPLVAVFALIAYTVQDIVGIAAYIYVFCVVRLFATTPLLDADSNKEGAILKGFIRNLPIVIALPFTSYWLAIFLLQSLLYYGIGRVRTRYPFFNSIAVSEMISGGIWGAII